MSAIEDLVRRVYPALASGDRAALGELLAPDFDGVLAEGMPLGIGGRHAGAEAMQRDGWWAIGRAFAVQAEPQDWIPTADGRLLVTGRYRGHARETDGALDAAFAHLWSSDGECLTALRHFTDTARWAAALDDIPESGGASR